MQEAKDNGIIHIARIIGGHNIIEMLDYKITLLLMKNEDIFCLEYLQNSDLKSVNSCDLKEKGF